MGWKVMPLKRLKNGRYRAISYSTGKALGPKSGESKAKAEARSRTSKRRASRTRYAKSKRSSKRRYR